MFEEVSIVDLELKYLYGTMVYFDGNVDIRQFQGTIVGFEYDLNDSIYARVKDEFGDVTDIYWSELKDSRFKFEE